MNNNYNNNDLNNGMNNNVDNGMNNGFNNFQQTTYQQPVVNQQPMVQSVQTQPVPPIPPQQQVYGQQQAFNQTPQQPKKGNKWIVIIGILIVVGIIVGGIFLFKGKNGELGNRPGSKYNGSKEEYIIATVGHVGHGKSELTSAITKLYGDYVTVEELDNAPELDSNGLKYKMTYVGYDSGDRHYTHYDMPNFVDYIKPLVSGDIKLDGAILVVSVIDGPMMQTRTVLELLQELGVKRIVVYLNNCDVIDDEELLDLVEMEVETLLDEYGFDADNTPIIRGSANKVLDGDKNYETSIHEVVKALDSWIVKDNDATKTTENIEFEAHIYVLSNEEGGRHTPFYNNYRPQIKFGSSETNTTISLPDGVEMIMPTDDYGKVRFRLDKKLEFKKGDNFGLYEGGSLIGVGTVTNIIE